MPILTRIFHRRDDDARPVVELDDVLQYIHDPEYAAQALGELQRLEADELVDTYIPTGWIAERRFNVWLSHRLRPPQGERITLEEWCARWLAVGGEGGAA